MTRIISIEGNIGSGKSTLVQKLKEYYSHTNKICFLQEPVDIWNTITDKNGKTIIEHFYSNPEKYSFAFQMMAYISRLATIQKELKEDYDIIFTERCVFTDRNVFAKMLYDDDKINEVEFKIYNSWFDHFIEDFPEIEYVYLETNPQTAFERIIKRGRIGEDIPVEYLKACNEYHDDWLSHHKNKCVIKCDTDIIEHPEIITQWIETIDSFTNSYTITFDGASRGNPGLCGAGFVIWKNNEIMFKGKQFISESNTNNYAEYSALIIGLEYCNKNNIKNLIIEGDSLLVIKQLKKEYKIESSNLLPLYNKCIDLLQSINSVEFNHIKRDKNSDADKLANEAINEYLANDVGVWSRA
jgi:deoxyadenosine/deoxycytidine kinase/ribonuclease HI